MATLACPVPSCSTVSTRFGVPAALGGGVHTGLDFPVRTLTPVKAPARGVVRDVFYNAGGGRMVAITHSDTLETRYAHLTSATVRKGQLVEAGQLIAYSGASGALVKGAHLHFEVWTGGRAVDPAPFLGGVGNTTPRLVCMRREPGSEGTFNSAGRMETMPAPSSGSCPAGWVGPYAADALTPILPGESGPELIGAAAGKLLGMDLDDALPVVANVGLIVAALLIGWGGVRRVLDGA